MPPESSTVCAEQSVEELGREVAEARRRETATAEILRVISRSATELQSVLDAVAMSSARLCDAESASIFRREDEQLILVAQIMSPEARARFVPGLIGTSSLPLIRGMVNGRAVLEARTVHIADLQSEGDDYPEGSENAQKTGHRTILAVPLLRDGVAIGSIGLRRTTIQLFSEAQVALIETFADQAVIAIENAPLFEAEQASKRELRESLEYQTAISDVLGVISASPNDVRPAYQTIVETAYRLCKANRAGLWRLEEGGFHIVAAVNPLTGHPRHHAAATTPLDRSSLAGRVGLEGQTVHIPDILVDPEYDKFRNRPGDDRRSMLGVPLLRLGQVIGAIILSRTRLKPFSEREIRLVETFADQAVIAIENARLFEAEQTRTRELSDALDQQTATAEVLRVISSSPGQLEPVFQAILANAVRICEAKFGALFRYDEGAFRSVAFFGVPHAFVEYQQRRGSFRPEELASRSILSCLWQTKDVSHIADTSGLPDPGPAVRYGGAKSIVGVPILKEGELIGAIFMYRQEVRPFTDRQIELVKSFASQAVIAIENTRLFQAEQTRTRELSERTQELAQALEYQTAIRRPRGDWTFKI
jgi:GAF domain-containing protein